MTCRKLKTSSQPSTFREKSIAKLGYAMNNLVEQFPILQKAAGDWAAKWFIHDVIANNNQLFKRKVTQHKFHASGSTSNQYNSQAHARRKHEEDDIDNGNDIFSDEELEGNKHQRNGENEEDEEEEDEEAERDRFDVENEELGNGYDEENYERINPDKQDEGNEDMDEEVEEDRENREQEQKLHHQNKVSLHNVNRSQDIRPTLTGPFMGARILDAPNNQHKQYQLNKLNNNDDINYTNKAANGQVNISVDMQNQKPYSQALTTRSPPYYGSYENEWLKTQSTYTSFHPPATTSCINPPLNSHSTTPHTVIVQVLASDAGSSVVKKFTYKKAERFAGKHELFTNTMQLEEKAPDS